MPTYAEIISIGDELLYGQTLDTNAHWISAQLDLIGIKVKRRVTIGDVEDEILNALKEAEERADVILITGGLGPTNDDLTKPLLAKYFNVGYVLNESALQEIKELFNKKGREITEPNRKQAELPANCTKLTNSMGTAPGMWFDERNTIFVSMPGVPYEMKDIMSAEVLPRLSEKFSVGVILHKIIRTVGIPESSLAELIQDWEAALPNQLKLAYLPSMGQVKLRITAIGDDKTQLAKLINENVNTVLPLIQKYVYGFDDDELEKVVGETLLKHNKSIAFAESCTGGYLSHMITSIPGSSAYFKGSIVSYDYDVKVNSLDVNLAEMEEKGAVSEEVVVQMATAVREKLNADVGLSISGIAGPGGGTEEKPVGTVWICYSDKEKTIAKKFNFTRDRVLNIKFSALAALNMFRIHFSSN
ncbi:MAG: competence/damage-inducible protein A [Flammeovirgaceae bacterium]|nr:competence/damage-inducible protein A [Flammeovirgaceae bacterium]MBE62817.1 competence/damage-inducible protein A [Flammeovirgaceae bacterium]HCX23131.1 competence/damage-inducible protein A [Cytophagales bacterium]|tara:strand:+ start:4984 stop:6231 length:1248 start_codon:yes stop_codon:yes gene_type:complete